MYINKIGGEIKFTAEKVLPLLAAFFVVTVSRYFPFRESMYL